MESPSALQQTYLIITASPCCDDYHSQALSESWQANRPPTFMMIGRRMYVCASSNLTVVRAQRINENRIILKPRLSRCQQWSTMLKSLKGSSVHTDKTKQDVKTQYIRMKVHRLQYSCESQVSSCSKISDKKITMRLALVRS